MHIRRLLNASVLAFVCFCYSGGCNGEVNEQPEHFTDTQLVEMRRLALEQLQGEQAAGEIPRMNPEQLTAAVDRVVTEIAGIRSRVITKGSFLGLTIGDSQTELIAKLRARGAISVLGDNPAYSLVSSANDLPRLYSSSEFVMHPSSIRITLEGDRVKRVVVPRAGLTSPYREAIQKATTRADLFSVFAKFLAEDGERLIERVEPEPHIVLIGSDDPLKGTGLVTSQVWLTEFRDESHRLWRLNLRFDNSHRLVSFSAVSGNG